MLTQTIKEQTLTVRNTGLTNMFGISTVQRIAHDLGLLNNIADNTAAYARFILTGKDGETDA